MSKLNTRQKLIRELSEKIKKEGEVKSKHDCVPMLKVEDLRRKYGFAKKIPKQYELQILTALSYYPELKNEKISFILSPAIFSMETRVHPLSILKKKRHYIIRIKKRTADIYFTKFALETVVALLCHELSHVVDYKNKSKLDLLFFPIKYIFPKTRQKIELKTELRSFHHGTGKLMIIYYDEFMKNIDLIVKRKRLKNYTKKYRNKYYLRKEEIEHLLKLQK